MQIVIIILKLAKAILLINALLLLEEEKKNESQRVGKHNVNDENVEEHQNIILILCTFFILCLRSDWIFFYLKRKEAFFNDFQGAKFFNCYIMELGYGAGNTRQEQRPPHFF